MIVVNKIFLSFTNFYNVFESTLATPTILYDIDDRTLFKINYCFGPSVQLQQDSYQYTITIPSTFTTKLV